MTDFISIDLFGQTGAHINDGPITVSTKLTVGVLQLAVRKHLEGIGKVREDQLIKIIHVGTLLTNSLQPITECGITDKGAIYWVLCLPPTTYATEEDFIRLQDLIINYETYDKETALADFRTILEKYKLTDEGGSSLQRTQNETLYTLMAETSRYELLEILLQYNTFQRSNSSIDTPNSRGLTPFNLSVYYDDLDSVELLLKAGVDISKENQEIISSAVLISVTQQNFDCLELLLLYKSLNILSSDVFDYALNALDTEATETPADGNAPIHKVVLQEYNDKPSAEEIEEIEKNGLKYDGRDDYEMLRLLLSTGRIDLNQLNENNESALALALHDKNRVNLLLDAGADINVKQGYNITPLMIASRDPEFFTEVDTMRLLLVRGANIVDLDDDGETALFQTFNLDKIQLLLSYISQQYLAGYINHRNSEGKTAYQVAQNAGEYKVCELLVSRGATFGGKKGKKRTRKGKGRKKRRKTKCRGKR